MEEIKQELNVANVTIDKSVVKVSVIGVGMRTNSGVARRMFETLAELNINIQAIITTSEIKIRREVYRACGSRPALSVWAGRCAGELNCFNHSTEYKQCRVSHHGSSNIFVCARA